MSTHNKEAAEREAFEKWREDNDGHLDTYNYPDDAMFAAYMAGRRATLTASEAPATEQAPSTAAQEDAVACIQAIKDWDTNGFIKRGALLALPQEIRARMQAILDAALAHKGAQEGEKENG